ncbi:phage portal protein [uncultured Hoeflea sp.]|uniref:phage portal protein n=1 Tax=uncultured Hoeflea sp. TaxID=538666 RepID=UPI00260EE2BA|nr:phage portal protein [uncultured Hoeflea sp.]
MEKAEVMQVPRVARDGTVAKRAGSGSPVVEATMRMLRDSPSGVLAARLTPVAESRDEIRRSWRTAAALALDFIHNSGRLKGAVDQVIADTVGSELILKPAPDYAKLGWSKDEAVAWAKLVKVEWKKHSWSPLECDHRGKFTVPQLVAISLRWHIAFGETTGILTHFDAPLRARYGLRTGSKLLLVPPPRLVQDTNTATGLFQGVYHDENGRPEGYLFEERRNGYPSKVRYPAFDASGRPVVMHIFDPLDADDVRGISQLTPILKQHAQTEVAREATLQTLIVQTFFAAVLTSKLPAAEAIESLQELAKSGGKAGKDIYDNVLGYLGSSLDRAAEGGVSLTGGSRIPVLGPDEDLQFRQAQAPGDNYLPLTQSLDRDMARAIGVTYGAYTMDHSDASYSSVRMENASIWPVVMRRREHIAAPMYQLIYEQWLDEKIETGAVPFKGGLANYRADRDAANWAQWQGPEKPTADDLKSEKAASERIANGTSSIPREAELKGVDSDELFDERSADHQRYVDAGMRSPYDRDAPAPAQPVEIQPGN